jgi:hypothetical protein
LKRYKNRGRSFQLLVIIDDGSSGTAFRIRGIIESGGKDKNIIGSIENRNSYVDVINAV